MEYTRHFGEQICRRCFIQEGCCVDGQDMAVMECGCEALGSVREAVCLDESAARAVCDEDVLEILAGNGEWDCFRVAVLGYVCVYVYVCVFVYVSVCNSMRVRRVQCVMKICSRFWQGMVSRLVCIRINTHTHTYYDTVP
jgi:hypothetical protein